MVENGHIGMHMQLVEFKKEARHDKSMVRKGGKSQTDILQYAPKEALKRQYTQKVGADMLDNMDMEMEMAMKASTGNEEIIADIIRKVHRSTLGRFMKGKQNCLKCCQEMRFRKQLSIREQ